MKRLERVSHEGRLKHLPFLFINNYKIMFNNDFNYIITKTAWIGKVFRNHLPENAFIDKGRCAIGGTTLETKYKKRTTIMIVSNIGIILSKQSAEELDERPDYVVYGEITQTMVNKIIADVKCGDKIMSTPEGIRKIMKAAEKIGRLEEVYKDWFLLLDESHTFISEDYRDDILAPFDYFWTFDNKSIISATPYYFSDSRMKHLDLHKIEFTESINTIVVVDCLSVQATLDYVLRGANSFPGNLHIFYNSVIPIKSAILRAEIKDCSIYCAGNESNLNKLADLSRFYHSQPNSSNFSKINFYTSRYFEGWDLNDENATIILVTDYRMPHTAVGIGNKGKQAIGRARKTIHNIIHLTNHRNKKERLTLDDYVKAFNEEAQLLIQNHNFFIQKTRTDKLAIDLRLKYFADVDKATKIATLNPYKLDQQINEAANSQTYQHIQFIIEDWNAAYFDVERKESRLKLEGASASKRKSTATKLKEDFYMLKEFHSEEPTHFRIGRPMDEIIKERNPTAHKMHEANLSEEYLKKIKFNRKRVNLALTVLGTDEAEMKANKMIKLIFQIGKFYFNSFINQALENIYLKAQLINPTTGKIRIASPIQLGEPGRFIVKKGKQTNSEGEREDGYHIIDENLGLRVTEI